MSAKIIPFRSEMPASLAPKPLPNAALTEGTLAIQPPVSGDNSAASRIDRRGKVLDRMYHFIRSSALGMVSDWPELFELGREHALFQWGQHSNRKKSSEVPSSAVEEFLRECEKDLADDLNFYNRCAQIYAEEMKSVEARATRARAHVARRIQEEFGHMASGIPEALLENDPQKWADEINWI